MSYAVILHNASSNADAVNVSVLVNFVLADNKLLGSQSSNVQLLRAGSSYALGSNFTLPPGTRAVFKLTSGFNPIPTARAGSATVSVIPSWKQPGS